jgi:TRAP-type C4-dicarboxylate transport system substrate-binding protein
MLDTRRRLASLAGMAVALAATPITPAAAQTKWDFYGFTGVTHPISVRFKTFADEVKAATGGKLEIVFRPAGELPFRATEVVKATAAGQVQLAAAYQGFISGELPTTSMASLPFLVRTPEELEKAYPIIEKYNTPVFAKRGVKVLFWHTWPVQNIYGKGTPIKTIDDFKGRKIRSTDGKQAEMLKQLGAASVNLTTPEVPVAMERGVAEGFLTAGFNVIGAKWYEFTQWGWMGDVHMGGPEYVIMNIAAYDKLDAAVKAKLDEVAKAYGPKMRAQNLGDEKGAQEELKSKHKIELFVPPKAQVDELTNRMKPYWESWAKQHGPEAEAQLKEIRAALGK